MRVFNRDVKVVGRLIRRSGTATGSGGAATLDRYAGVITTESLTTAAGGTTAYTINNRLVKAGDIVLCSLENKGTQGTPFIYDVKVEDGKITLGIKNDHATQALNGALALRFQIVSVV